MTANHSVKVTIHLANGSVIKGELEFASIAGDMFELADDLNVSFADSDTTDNSWNKIELEQIPSKRKLIIKK